MRTQANLPRGVENIIPHIEAVDNVPLLVPLFTDCQNECELLHPFVFPVSQ